MKMKELIVFIVLLGLCPDGNCQFLGGSNDGFDMALLKNSFSVYHGGNGDGHDLSGFQNAYSIYHGSEGDGHDQSYFKNAFSIYFGNQGDGYSNSNFKNTFSIYYGGQGDGHDRSRFKNSFNIYSGGSKDGYDQAAKILIFEWSGAVGTGWNVAGNWSELRIPDIYSRVVIPSSVPNFPFINEGLMSIGENPNGGLFLCRNIMIDPGAELTMRINAFLENYGNINIKGTVFVLNPLPGSFQNLSGGNITIESGGVLEIK